MFTIDVDVSFKSCSKCDLSVECNFKPSKGKGDGNSVLFIIPTLSKAEYNKGIGTGRKFNVIYKLIAEYGFRHYLTSLVKCISKDILRDSEIENCSDKLKLEIYKVNPKIIVTIGDVVTKRFINYKRFANVVDVPKVIKINGREVIIYPINHPNFDKANNSDIYLNSFERLAMIYKKFVDKEYVII